MKKILCTLFVTTSIWAFTACEQKVELPDNLASFTTTAQGLEGDEASIQIALSRAADATIPINIQLTPTLLTYNTEFTTEPAASNNVITATIPAGQSGVTIKVKKKANVFLNGDESLTFKR